MAGPTIQNILALPSPTFTLTSVGTGTPRSCDKWERVQPWHVRQWDDFNLNTISGAFGDLLDQPASVAMGGLCADRGIRNLKEMKNHSIDWLLRILESPVTIGGRLLGHRLGFASAVDHSRDTTFPGAKHKYESSLIFYHDAIPRIHFVVSCARLSSQWTSEGLKNQDHAAVLPIRQLATYAKESGTRYSFYHDGQGSRRRALHGGPQRPVRSRVAGHSEERERRGESDGWPGCLGSDHDEPPRAASRGRD
ncbi:hypothetical protein CEP52_015941 [Fusarium oligoseptatum]|uniref:Uncharacterized protein n=1 Tax=Fusarium oligoseptatum TaxID=2604345 RepID=A0A428S8C9_9HYPO|nr:hypothetical protein CEP52_015941 [Fusarium oligoseptatum]